MDLNLARQVFSSEEEVNTDMHTEGETREDGERTAIS